MYIKLLKLVLKLIQFEKRERNLYTTIKQQIGDVGWIIQMLYL